MNKSMIEGKPLRLIVEFSIPLLLGNLFQQFYNMADAAIVGQTLGSKALAAVGSSASIQFLVLGFCIGICQGFAILVSQYFGAGDEKEMRKYMFTGAVWTAIFAVIITVLVSLLCPQILHLLQVNSEIYDNAYAYLIVIFLGIPFTLLYNFLSSVLRAIGDSKTPFMFLAFSALLNIALDFFCILVLGWGCSGAAIATIFAQGVSGILCLLLIIKKFHILHIQKEERVFNGYYSKRVLSMGIPMGLQFSITAIGSMVLQSSNNALGTVYVSGFTAGMRIKQLMMSPFDALGAGVSTFLSQNYGARKTDRIRSGFRIGMGVAAGYGLFACAVLGIFGRGLSMLFVNASEVSVLDASAMYLRRIGYFYPVLGTLIVARMGLQGLGFSSRAMAGGLLEMVARIFVALVFVPLFRFDAITWSDQVAWTAALLYLIPMWLYCFKEIQTKIQQEKMLENM